jgi:hypothetical protein
MTYQLEAEKKHLNAIAHNAEIYYRLRSGQLEIAFDEAFRGEERYLDVMQEVEGHLAEIKKLIFPELNLGRGHAHGISSKVIPDDARLGIDMRQVIEHELWKERIAEGKDGSYGRTFESEPFHWQKDAPLLKLKKEA